METSCLETKVLLDTWMDTALVDTSISRIALLLPIHVGVTTLPGGLFE
ncbi:hypothetical protein OMR58_20715 [Erwinia sp. INIA-01]|nr:hypothetical protein [Erwinia sp. INIA01]MCW1876875.1 hypothetical protein [Erwinia sp. INIA01]